MHRVVLPILRLPVITVILADFKDIFLTSSNNFFSSSLL